MNPWFKFYGSEFLSDPKMAALRPVERSCWVTLLALASSSSEAGIIEFLTVEVLLQKSGVTWDPYHPEEWDSCLGILQKFQKMKMIQLSEDGSISIQNWHKRQDSHLSNAERQAKFREKQKESNAPRYKSNARIEENRIDEDINISNSKELRIEKITTEDEEREPRKKADTTYRGVFELWGKYPLNWKLNKSEIQAAKNLLEEHSLEGVKMALEFAAKHKDDPFCPEVSSPYSLDSKWGKLLAFKKKRV